MTIEDEIFKNRKADFNKILEYGFKKEDNSYKYSKNILNDTFQVIIEIDNNEKVKSKIIDLTFDDEYINFRIESNTGSFSEKVKKELENILKDIRKKCFINNYFIYEQTNTIVKLIREKYCDAPEFIWSKFPGYAVFRNKKNKKWYAIIMNIDKSKLDQKYNNEIEIINLKLDPEEICNYLKLQGFYPAYHMNKKNWITLVLDNTIPSKEIMNLIDKSYLNTTK